MVAAKNTTDEAPPEPEVVEPEPEAPEVEDTADAPQAPALGLGDAPPVNAASTTAKPEKGKPTVLATPLLQALSLPDVGGEKGIVITSDGIALSKADAAKAYSAAAGCGIELIDKTPAEPEKGEG